ncbi:MAG: hypothetical protein B7Y12_00465 [Rhizobiales bacterium 24-66-13]|jgi:hypothetical protein|nr:MAG: hypothetical protein B7Y12_00465 [Rhizobiales bacterium 24-66-13]OZB11729.1 MAG: hypothetical protein B7X67_02795 [Rhizobiales bacterium 39-66-18]HQS44804.1 hypothetical protein [Xanthobacteraceae bacterium]
MSRIRFSTFPRTEPPPAFINEIVEVFRLHEPTICTITNAKGLTSDAVLTALGRDLQAIGFDVERSEGQVKPIRRPVFFGENGAPRLQYKIDSWHEEWKCGLEIEAGRAWLGNAVYRDLIQALVMVDLQYLVLAVPNGYRRKSLGRTVISGDYDYSCAVADALFGHSRVAMPYRLVVIGY